MQVWDSVKVVDGDFKGQAGSVQAIKGDTVDVKLDFDGETRNFEASNLQRLG
jgi:transcription antitermination factor NusG